MPWHQTTTTAAQGLAWIDPIPDRHPPAAVLIPLSVRSMSRPAYSDIANALAYRISPASPTPITTSPPHGGHQAVKVTKGQGDFSEALHCPHTLQAPF